MTYAPRVERGDDESFVGRPAAAKRPVGGKRRVALLGPYSSRNLGDTATQMAAIHNIRLRRAEAEIVGISPDPADTDRSLGIASFPLFGRGPASGRLAGEFTESASGGLGGALEWPTTLRRMDRFVQTLDLLVVCGGGQLDDYWGGTWGHPWHLLLWTALARRHRVRVAFLAVGLDRLSTALSRRFAVWALRLASVRSFRDEPTQRAMRAFGLRHADSVCPDLAFSLNLDEIRLRGPFRDAAPFAVINPITHKTWSHQADSRHDRYLQELVEACIWLSRRGLALRVACSQPSMDTADANKLAQALRERQIEAVEVCDTPRVVDYIAQVQGADVVIAARLHGAILALVAGSPVITLSHLPKVHNVMEQAGFAKYSLPLQDFRATELVALLTEVLENVDEMRRRVADIDALHRNLLARMFDDLVALL